MNKMYITYFYLCISLQVFCAYSQIELSEKNSEKRLPFDCGIFPNSNFRGDPLTLSNNEKLELNSAAQFNNKSISVLLNQDCIVEVCTFPDSKAGCTELFQTTEEVPHFVVDKDVTLSASCHCFPANQEHEKNHIILKQLTSCAVIYKDVHYSGKIHHVKHSGSTGRIQNTFRSVAIKNGCSISFWSSLKHNTQFSFILYNSTSLLNNNPGDIPLWYCCSCNSCAESVCETARNEITSNEDEDLDYDFSQFVNHARKIIGVGRNYRWNKVELAKVVKQSEVPLIFLKPTSSFIEEGTLIELPTNLGAIFYELELGVVIGKRAKNVTEAEALDFVAGYFLALDMTAKEYLKKAISEGRPWELGKGFDYGCPVSTFIPKRMVPDPNALELRCRVNGNLTQHDSTSNMIFKVPELISYISKFMTLEPYDVILTGTPDGFGSLVPGDIVEGELGNLLKIRYEAV